MDKLNKESSAGELLGYSELFRLYADVFERKANHMMEVKNIENESNFDRTWYLME